MRPGRLQVWGRIKWARLAGWLVGWLGVVEQNGGRNDQLRRLGSLIRA